MFLFFRLKRYRVFLLSGIIIFLLGTIPVRMAIAFYQSPYPQAIMTLGGGKEREQFTARFVRNYPELEVWISGGLPPEQVDEFFTIAGASTDKLHLDYRAVDTVTNFTTLVQDFQQRHIQHLYLITSETHMSRASAIAILILGSHGIIFTPISFVSPNPEESTVDIIRDVTRSIVWILTGYTGASLKSHLPDIYTLR